MVFPWALPAYTAALMHRKPRILMVEDNPGDVQLITEAFREVGFAAHLLAVGDGDEALRVLGRQGEWAGHARPDLVLLDLNLPGSSGHDVLARIKTEPVLRRIPVVVLTSSRHADDIRRCYDAAANTYLVKPRAWADLLELVRSLERYWFSCAELPPR